MWSRTYCKGQVSGGVTRVAFRARYLERFSDPRFLVEAAAIERSEEIAWRNYRDARKAPFTEPAGEGYVDPNYELSTEWKSTRRRLLDAAERQRDIAGPLRLLVVCASPRNDGTRPGEVSKTWRHAQIVGDTASNECN